MYCKRYLGIKLTKKNQNNYEIGRNVEIRVCNFLNKLDWQTILSPGSRGAADIMALRNGAKWCIQVKFRTDFENSCISTTEWHYLADHSKKCDCLPVVVIASKFLGKKFKQINIHYKSENVWNIGDGYVAHFHNMFDGSIIEP